MKYLHKHVYIWNISTRVKFPKLEFIPQNINIFLLPFDTLCVSLTYEIQKFSVTIFSPSKNTLVTQLQPNFPYNFLPFKWNVCSNAISSIFQFRQPSPPLPQASKVSKVSKYPRKLEWIQLGLKFRTNDSCKDIHKAGE